VTRPAKILALSLISVSVLLSQSQPTSQTYGTVMTNQSFDALQVPFSPCSGSAGAGEQRIFLVSEVTGWTVQVDVAPPQYPA
jgi:hypothetical protein